MYVALLAKLFYQYLTFFFFPPWTCFVVTTAFIQEAPCYLSILVAFAKHSNGVGHGTK